LIVEDWQKARTTLENAGCIVKVTEVLAIEVTDEPGGLARILDTVDRASLNIEYMYAFAEKRGGKAVLVFRFEDPDTALRVLKNGGINVLENVKLFRLA